MKEEAPKQQWNKLYTIVLVANALYFVIFYIISKAF